MMGIFLNKENCWGED